MAEERKKMTVEEAGRKGGEKRKEELGHEGYQERGHKGVEHSQGGGRGSREEGSSERDFSGRSKEEREEIARKGGKSSH